MAIITTEKVIIIVVVTLIVIALAYVFRLGGFRKRKQVGTDPKEVGETREGSV